MELTHEDRCEILDALYQKKNKITQFGASIPHLNALIQKVHDAPGLPPCFDNRSIYPPDHFFCETDNSATGYDTMLATPKAVIAAARLKLADLLSENTVNYVFQLADDAAGRWWQVTAGVVVRSATPDEVLRLARYRRDDVLDDLATSTVSRLDLESESRVLTGLIEQLTAQLAPPAKPEEPKKPEEPEKPKVSRAKPLWRNNDGELIPAFLHDLHTQNPQPVSTQRPRRFNDSGTAADEDTLCAIVSAFEDAVHRLFNDCVRFAGLEIEGRESELSYEVCTRLAEELREWILDGWKDQDAEREARANEAAKRTQEKLAEYNYLRDRLEVLRKELGLAAGEGGVA